MNEVLTRSLERWTGPKIIVGQDTNGMKSEVRERTSRQIRNK